MFNFFKKKESKITINSISVPNFGWNKVEETSSRIVWVNPEESVLISLNFFDVPPDIPSAKNLDFLRKFYRNSIPEANGGIVEVSLLTINNVPSVKTIFKVPQPEGGMTYIASVTIPFENYSWVIKIQAAEIGITGVRDAIVLNEMLLSGEANFVDEKLENWFKDPYEPNFKEGTLMNKSEEEKYDIDFPDHPLSISRKKLNEAVSQTVFKSEINELSVFNK
ncbi:hypothetical protein [Chryseobacterium caseinilyticum]|uniref:Uncharacterized protein n=1 Tax=Chryseobacterium caseinilyticum TaxID=2771428 RepID=A0ABR8ZCX5_9FLAO|nr:hypothetical protein [Chryseobacterium caseinilyticum]MBD8082616.1 hypothetical protein [Chryseobacterium caseinilyticum]